MPDILDNLTRAGRPVPEPNATSDMPTLGAAPEPPPAPAATTPEPPPAAPEPAPATEAAPAENPDARTRREQRFAELTRQRDAERERATRAVDAAAALTEQTRALMAKLEQLTAPPPVDAPAQEIRPLRSQFEQPEDYDAALVEWSSRRAVAQATREWEQRQAAERQVEQQKAADTATLQLRQQQVEAWNTRRTAALEKYPDFADVAEADSVTVTGDMAQAMMVMDEGPDIAYHLGKNPTEAAAIAKLAPVQQIAAIGRLAAKLSAPPPPAAPPSTPPPINPLRTGSVPELSADEDPNYMDKRLAQLRSQRAPGNIGMARN